MSIRNILEESIFFEKSVVAQACIDTLGNYFNLTKIDLSESPSIHPLEAVRFGFPLTFFDEKYFTDPYIANFSRAFAKQEKFDVDKFSELQLASLLLGFGADFIEPVPRNNSRTHDFNVEWRSEKIEVEVTRSSKKELHIKLHEQAEEIAQLLHVLDREFDLVLHVNGLLDVKAKDRILLASQRIASGEVFSEEKQWHLCGKLITRHPHEIMMGGEIELKPEWWPDNEARLFFVKQRVAVTDAKVAPPRIKICYPAPYSGYLNSAKKKASRFQGSRQLPYLVAIDVNNLPNAFEAFSEGLEHAFRKWKHVSGVLIFEDYNDPNEFGWTFQVFRNPFATRPLRSDDDFWLPRSNERLRFARKPSN